MPKKLKAWPNERIDLPDFERAASEYSSESEAFDKERLILDRRSRILDGFRVQIDDQTAFPGQITVYNGNALDREGNYINDESATASSLTTTLSGASTTFYVQIERVESNTDTDSRAFWDPTYDNTSPDPDGSEFGYSVATRITPTWRLVVSTTGFDSTTDPNSTLVPLAVLSTDGSNQITSASTSGLSTVVASSILESDVASGAGSIRVLDSRLLGSVGDSIVIDVAGTSQTVTISSNDVDNGIISFAPVLTDAHQAGSIIRRTGVTARLLKEKTNPNSTSAHPDFSPRLWQANETRGSALMQSKETATSRDDLNNRSLRDYVDFLSGQIREMKFGHPRPDVVSNSPPSTFSTNPRYFESAGSIAGARTATVTIGNGTTSFGDFNGTTETVFSSAIAALPASGGVVYIKAGTYSFTTNFVSISKPVVFVGESQDTVTIIKKALTTCFQISSSINDNYGFYNLRIETDTTVATNSTVIMLGSGTFYFDNVYVNNGALYGAAAGIVSLRMNNCTIANTAGFGTDRCVDLDSAVVTNSYFKNCSFSCTGSNANEQAFDINVTSYMQVLRFEECLIGGYTALDFNASTVGLCTITDCYLSSIVRAIEASGNLTGFEVDNSYIVTSAVPASESAIKLGPVTRGSLRNNYFNVTFAGAGTLASPGKIVEMSSGTVSGFTVSGCHFQGPGAGAFVAGVYLDGCDYSDALVSISSCTFYGCSYAVKTNADVGGSHLALSDVRIHGDNLDKTPYGVYTSPTGSFSLSLSGVKISDLKSTTDDVIGVYINNGALVDLTASDVIIDGLTSTAGSSYGFRINGATVSHNAVIHDSIVKNLTGTNCYGVYCLGTSGGSSQHISNVHMYTFSGTVGAYGIRVSNSDQSCISSITDEDLTGGTSSVAYICDGTFSDSSISDCVFDRSIVLANGMTRSLICNNQISLKITGNTEGIRVSYSAGDTGLVINNNNITMNSSTAYGIVLSPKTTGTATNVSVCNNQVYDISGNTGILISGEMRNLSCDNNRLYEGTFSVNSAGIQIAGSGVSNLIKGLTASNNIVYTGTSGSAATRNHEALRVQYAWFLTIANNSLYWTESSLSVAGNTLTLDTVSFGTVSGNMTYTSSGSHTELTVSTGTSLTVVGNTVPSGVISVNGTGYVAGSEGIIGATTNTFGFNNIS